MAGENYPLDDESILALRAPKNSIDGSYMVVFKDMEECYAIVALDWNGIPSLAIRWFLGNGGNPFSSGHPTWFVYPSGLLPGLLKSLPLNFITQKKIKKYLSGELPGSEL